jgi:hypothetical protein
MRKSAKGERLRSKAGRSPQGVDERKRFAQLTPNAEIRQLSSFSLKMSKTLR